MDGVGTPIIGRPRPLPGHDTPNPTNNTYTLKCEESVFAPPAARVRQYADRDSPATRPRKTLRKPLADQVADSVVPARRA